MAETLEDLNNTKLFSKLNDKELKKWFEKRTSEELKNVPLLPNEPIAYFDMDDQTEIIVEASIRRPVRFIKFIPTGFRKRPINFSSKPFNANQVECQFFGVNGFETSS